ncbi:MAG: hypothetical protein E7580_06325 [Ruminococcaceae bacterium]|nr:hypothetical protein [Oscillospiraceae bacterium]
MDFLFELIFELFAEGTVELSKCTKVPKWIRYPLIGIIVLFSAGILAIILFTGIAMLRSLPIVGILFIVLAVALAVIAVFKFKKTYLKRKNK